MVNALRAPIPEAPSQLNIHIAAPSRASSSSSSSRATSSDAKHAQEPKAEHADATLASAAAHTAPHAAPSAPSEPADALRYTITEPTVHVKEEHAEASTTGETANGNATHSTGSVPVPNGDSAQHSATSAIVESKEEQKVKTDADSDSESSDVSDDEEVDTSTWTNSLMSLYEEPVRHSLRFIPICPMVITESKGDGDRFRSRPISADILFSCTRLFSFSPLPLPIALSRQVHDPFQKIASSKRTSDTRLPFSVYVRLGFRRVVSCGL